MEAKKGFLRLSCSVFAGFLGVTAGCLGLLDTLIYCALRVLPSERDGCGERRDRVAQTARRTHARRIPNWAESHARRLLATIQFTTVGASRPAAQPQ